MAASTQTIQKMYIAYFGRPADTIGLQYWADKTEAQIIAGFSASSESQALFGNQGSAAKVNAIYNNLFARDAEPAGLQYWVQKLNSGEVSQAEAMYTILNNAGAGDATAVANKLAAAEAFTAQIDTTPEILGYTGANAAQSAREWLGKVNANAASLDAAKASAPAALAAAAGASAGDSGKTFTLTTNTDAPGATAPAANTQGTSGNDTFNAVVGTGATLSAADQIDGGAGTDTLRVVTDADVSILGTNVQNVEKLSVTNVDTGVAHTAAIVGSSSFTSFENASSLGAVTFNGATKVDALSVKDTASATTISYTDAAVAGTADALSLSLSGVSATAGVGATVNVNSATAAGAGVETVNLISTGAATNNIVLNSNDTTIKTLNISGAAGLTANVSALALTTVDGSKAAGALNISNFGAADATVTGGTGNDRFNFGATLTSADKVDGGAGTDTVAVSTAAINAAAAADIAAIKALTNVEVLELTAAGAVLDASQITNISNFAFSGGGATAVTGTTNAQTFAFTADAGAVAFAPKLDAGADVLNLALTSQVGVTSTITSVAAGNYETVNIAATGPAADAITALTVNTNAKVIITGSADFTTTVVGTNATLDASAATGKVTLTGEAGNNTIIGGSANDILSGAGGQDSIDLSKGGLDTVRFAQTAVADRDTITGFQAGAGGDVLDVAAQTFTTAAGGVDEVLAAQFKDFTGTAGAFTFATANTVQEFSFNAANNAANLANATDGAELFKAIANQGSTIAGITAGNAADAGTIVAYQNGNAYVYHYDASGVAADTTISAAEIALVGTINGVAAGSLTDANFA